MENKSILYYAKKIDEIDNEKTDDNDENKHFINNEKITVGEQPQTFYYMYDNDEYYFTASNAKFFIDELGNITWYYGDWINGFFRNGKWIDGTWHNGTFCRGNWIGGKWINGKWYQGQIDGTNSNKHP